MKIPFVDLSLQYKLIKKEILNKFDEISSKGNYILSKITSFDNLFKTFDVFNVLSVSLTPPRTSINILLNFIESSEIQKERITLYSGLISA